MSRIRWIIVLGWAFGLAACSASGATPQLIGAYPKTTSAPPPATIVYNTNLTLEVYDPAPTAERAIQIAYDFGGYLVSSEMWSVGDDQYFTLTLAVPAAQFSGAREALLKLGTLINETVTSEWKYGGQWDEYSTLTVNLRPAQPSLPRPAPINLGWNPVNTFSRAFGVFARLFTFLVDALIWVAVVLGPFVLMGLGLRAVIQRLRRRA
jgi:hypothetical protein